MDGEWEAPQVPNPACQTAPGCGEWKPPTINNPNYKGKWKAPLIDNPNYQVIPLKRFWKRNSAIESATLLCNMLCSYMMNMGGISIKHCSLL